VQRPDHGLGRGGGGGSEGGGVRGFRGNNVVSLSVPSTQGSNGSSMGAPSLTGNKEADDDIAAYYKAKEDFLKRRTSLAGEK